MVKTITRRKAWPVLLHRFVRTIRSRTLLNRGQHVLVAVSGGPDSVCLLSLLHWLQASWSLSLTAVHFNYGLRGTESEADEEFVVAFCRERGIPLEIRRFGVPFRSHYTSLQAVARDFRYSAMMDLAEQYGADRIAVGHTADDQAETVLLWILRGAGLTGLSGMPAHRDGKIIRPLLETRREDILAYLHAQGLSFRLDSTNFKPLYLRNRIRLEVLPVLQRLLPSSIATLCRLADICREDDRYLDQQVTELCASRVSKEVGGAWSIDRTFLQQLPHAAQRRLVRNLLRRCDHLRRSPSIRTIEDILRMLVKNKSACRITVRSARVLIGKDLIQFLPSKSGMMFSDPSCHTIPVVLAVPGQVEWPETRQIIQAQELNRQHHDETIHERNQIVVDADCLSTPLIVRAWRSGDWFHPSGMQGRSKKLQDLFTDLKVARAVRSRIPVVTAPEGIVWVVGYRQDDRWSLSASTRRCIMLSAKPFKPRGGS